MTTGDPPPYCSPEQVYYKTLYGPNAWGHTAMYYKQAVQDMAAATFPFIPPVRPAASEPNKKTNNNLLLLLCN